MLESMNRRNDHGTYLQNSKEYVHAEWKGYIYTTGVSSNLNGLWIKLMQL